MLPNVFKMYPVKPTVAFSAGVGVGISATVLTQVPAIPLIFNSLLPSGNNSGNEFLINYRGVVVPHGSIRKN